MSVMITTPLVTTRRRWVFAFHESPTTVLM